MVAVRPLGVQQAARSVTPAPIEKKPATSRAPLVTVQDGFEKKDAAKPAEKRPILLYNDQCQVCRLLSGWVKAQDAAGKDLIDERPIGGDPEALLQIHPDLDIWKVYETIHLVMPDGTLKKGGEAIGEVLKKLPATGWLAPLLDLSIGGFKPFQKLLDAGYVTLDKLRPAIGCESCGGGPVKWWALPVKWTADAVRAVHKLFA